MFNFCEIWVDAAFFPKKNEKKKHSTGPGIVDRSLTTRVMMIIITNIREAATTLYSSNNGIDVKGGIKKKTNYTSLIDMLYKAG